MTVKEYDRRLAACWNACDGLDTQGLEDIVANGDNIKARQERDETRVLVLTHQRDQLSAALGTSTANYSTLAAKLAQAESQRDALLAQLQEAVRLYESYGLVAGVYGCGKWVNDSREAIANTTRTPS